MTAERIWIKELTGIEVGDLPGLINFGYAVYLSAMGDTQGFPVRGVKPGENPFDDPSTILFVDDAHPSLQVQPTDRVRLYIVGWPEPWTDRAREAN